MEKLSFIGLIAPRGPQIPAGVGANLSALQEPEQRIDSVRDIWLTQLADAERLLDAFAYQPAQ